MAKRTTICVFYLTSCMPPFCLSFNCTKLNVVIRPMLLDFVKILQGVFSTTTTCKKPKPSDRSQNSSSSLPTVLSRLHHDDISFTEAIDKYTTPTVRLPNNMDHPQDELGEIDIICGDRVWWKPKMMECAWDNLVYISDFWRRRWDDSLCFI